MMNTINRVTTYLRSEPALTRACGTLIVGIVAALGFHLTQNQLATYAAAGMGVLALVQGWRTRSATNKANKPTSSMGDWRNAMPVEDSNAEPAPAPEAPDATA